MTDPRDTLKLVIYWPDGQTCRYISALRATANYYGWTKEFEIWRPKTAFVENGYRFAYAPPRSGRGHPRGGKRIRISRAESRQGHPAGLTNQFSISNSMRTIDLAELANFTEGDWYWMEDLSGRRISKEHWAAIYRSSTTRNGRGLVLN